MEKSIGLLIAGYFEAERRNLYRAHHRESRGKCVGLAGFLNRLVDSTYARFLIWNNRPEDAKPYLSTEIQESKASETERLFLTAMVARMTQRFADSQEILSRLHQQDARSFPIGNHLALVLIESDQESLRGRALQIAEVNVRNNPGLSDAWATLGYIQFCLGDLVSAEKSLNTSVQNGQLSRDAAFYLAKIKQTLGLKDDAKKLYDTAMSLPGPIFYPELNK